MSKSKVNAEQSASKIKEDAEASKKTNSRADVLKKFQFGGVVVEESSPRID